MSDMMINFSDLGQVGKASLGTNIAGAGLGGLMDIGNFIQNSIYAKRDRDFRDQVYKETKEREDTAVQRRIADMAKAGISPLASVGGAGASAGGSSVSAPMVSANGANPFRGVFQEAVNSDLLLNKNKEQMINNFRMLQAQSNFERNLEYEATELEAMDNEAKVHKIKAILEHELFRDPAFEDLYQDSIESMYKSFDLDNKLKEAREFKDYMSIGVQFIEWAVNTYLEASKPRKRR